MMSLDYIEIDREGAVSMTTARGKRILPSLHPFDYYSWIIQVWVFDYNGNKLLDQSNSGL